MASGHEGLATRLYRGQVSYDFIGHRKRWYIGSGILILISFLSIGTLVYEQLLEEQ